MNGHRVTRRHGRHAQLQAPRHSGREAAWTVLTALGFGVGAALLSLAVVLLVAAVMA